MPETHPQTSFPDVADVVSVRTKGELPVIVGGHAVNIWALTYASRLGSRLSPYAPFTSKDLDLWGPKEILDSLAQKYGVKITLSPPRSPGVGYVMIPKGDLQLKVELLTGVPGPAADQCVRTHDRAGLRIEPAFLGTRHDGVHSGYGAGPGRAAGVE